MPPKPPAPPGSPARPSSRSGPGKGGPRPRKGATDKAARLPGLDGEATGPERIAKVLARAGIASRRDAEAIVLEGRVAVNGVLLDTPAVTVTPQDRITVDGQPLPQADRARLWLYHKPTGLVTTARDEQGRDTVFDALPDDLPRVMPVGRLDITSEGLLLLTNDGGLKRKLELPSTGWLRKYRVRVHGTPTEAQLAPLKAGIVIEGERFQPMIVGLDRQQGANAWLTVGLREGKNREIRRAMEAVGLAVNRLIRISYGPFQLGDLAPGAVEEIKPRVLRDQLGMTTEGIEDTAAAPAKRPPRNAPRNAPRNPGGTGAGTESGSGPRTETRAQSRGQTRTAPRPDARNDPAGTGGTVGKGGTGGTGGSERTGRSARADASAPARKSWGMKSHGGAPARATDGPDPSGRAAAPGAGPRSWGRKSHGGAAGSTSGSAPASGGKPATRQAPGAVPGGADRSGPRPGPGAAPRAGGPKSGSGSGPRNGPRGGPARPKR